MTTNKSFGHSHAPQETVTNCGYVVLQVNVSAVVLVANKYIALNDKCNTTGHYPVRVHKH